MESKSSQGCEELKRILENNTEDAVAQAVGVSQQAVSDWRRGRSRPRGRAPHRLEEVYGIKTLAWYSAPRPEPAPAKRARRPATKRTETHVEPHRATG